MSGKPPLRLILHIGSAKSGSSAIQWFLRDNHKGMLGNGVLTPDKALDMVGPMEAEQIFFFEQMNTADNAEQKITQRLTSLRQYMLKQRLHTLIVSAENLLERGPRLADPLARAAVMFDDVRIICYVRRQDDFLISAWQQWFLKEFASLHAFLTVTAGVYADWNSWLRPWEDAFGTERITVRPFQRDRLTNGDVVTDFLKVMDVPHANTASLSGLSNRSFDEHLGDLAHRIRDEFDSIHDNRFYDTMLRTIGEQAYKSQRGSHLLTVDERIALVSRYAEGNEALKHRYLPEWGDAPLFEPPSVRDVIKLNPVENLAAENALLTRAVYRLSIRLQVLEGEAAKAARKATPLFSHPHAVTRRDATFNHAKKNSLTKRLQKLWCRMI